MKKIVIFLMIACIMLSSCSKAEKKQPESVAEYEDLSQYTISYDNTDSLNQSGSDEQYTVVGSSTQTNQLQFDSAEELYEGADYVVVASPKISYAESKQFWFDKFNTKTEFSKISSDHSYSVRPFEVKKVLKGDDKNKEEIVVCEHILLNENKIKACDGAYPLQQGDEYLLFLFESVNEEQYFPLSWQGAYNVDDAKNEEQHIDTQMLAKVRELFKDEFK